MLLRYWAASVLCLIFALSVRAADTSPTHDEYLLKRAGIKTDDAGLLAFVQSVTPSDEVRFNLQTRIEQLGDRSFKVREQATKEIRSAGLGAVPILRGALDHTDAEVRKRSRELLDEIKDRQDDLLLPCAFRLLSKRNPKGSLEALFQFAPSAHDDSVRYALYEALREAGLEKGKPTELVRETLKAKDPMRRALAVYILGQALGFDAEAIRGYLADPAIDVRFQAALILAELGDKKAVPVFLDSLTQGPLWMAGIAEERLFALAGDDGAKLSLKTDGETRKKCQAEWREWWKKNGEQFNGKRLRSDDAGLGLTLICQTNGPNEKLGRVWECDKTGKAIWEVQIKRPTDAQVLPGQRTLIADFYGDVLETDRAGKPLWNFDTRGDKPVSCQRLPSGNTLVGTYRAIREVTPKGEVLFQLPRDDNVYSARKERNGRMLFLDWRGNVLEVDVAGRTLYQWEVGTNKTWGSAELLSNGNCLVACPDRGEVVELNRGGEAVWTCRVSGPVSAVRLPNGNTLVCSYEERLVQEFDRDGKVVWKVETVGHPLKAKRR